jgi:hypothetical protein
MVFGPEAEDFGPDYPDFCAPLNAPTWVKPDAATLMRDDDTVAGFEAAGQQWAIPWWVMKNHHVANLTIDDKPLLVTLCEYCAGGGVYDPVVEGRRLWFHKKGLYGGTPMITDDATGSLWRMVNTEPLLGPALEIGRLPKRPIVHTRWGEWRAMYPDTWVVHGEGEPRDGHGSECESPEHGAGAGPLSKAFAEKDLRLEQTELVVGVELGGVSRAYPLAAVHAAGGIVTDTIAGRPIVVVTRPGTWLAVTFERDADQALVDLSWDEAEDPPAHLVDESSGSRFDLWGACTSGPLEATRLRYVTSSLRRWSIWTLTNPGCELWSASEVAAPAPS